MPQHKPKQKLASQPSMLSEERIVDSDSDDQEVQQTSADRQTSKASASVIRSAEKKATLTNGKKHETPHSKSSSEGEALLRDEDDEEGEQSGGESDEVSNASSSSGAKRASSAAATVPPRKKARPTAPTAIAPKAFKPPNGFEKTKRPATDYAHDSTAFLSEDLARKQIWHITAPASVNIGEIQSFNIQDVRSGKPVFSKNGVDYGFLTGLHKNERLLLATTEDVEYTPAGAPVSGTYHLREISKSQPKNNAGADKEISGISFAANSTIPPNAPRQQPPGLRMRYQPYGSVQAPKSRISPTSPPTFRMVPELPESRLDKSEKKKQREEEISKPRKESQDVHAMDVDPTPSSSVKNPESARPAKSASQMVNDAFEAAIETPVTEKKRKKKKKHKVEGEAVP